jgi:hypothetical protein
MTAQAISLKRKSINFAKRTHIDKLDRELNIIRVVPGNTENSSKAVIELTNNIQHAP